MKWSTAPLSLPHSPDIFSPSSHVVVSSNLFSPRPISAAQLSGNPAVRWDLACRYSAGQFWTPLSGPASRTAPCSFLHGMDAQPLTRSSPPHASPSPRELHHEQMHGRIRRGPGTAAGALEPALNTVQAEDRAAAG